MCCLRRLFSGGWGGGGWVVRRVASSGFDGPGLWRAQYFRRFKAEGVGAKRSSGGSLLPWKC